MSKPKSCKACGHEFRLKKENKDQWETDLMPCPECFETFCEKPQTERDLFRLQLKYLHSKNKKKKEEYFYQMYEIWLSYTGSLIKKRFSSLIISEQFMEEKCMDTVHLLVEKYLMNPEFKIKDSFAGFLQRKIREVLFGKKHHATGKESLNYKYDDGNQVDYEDEKDILKDVEKSRNKFLLQKYCMKIIEENIKECNDNHEDFRRMFAINLFMKYGEKKADTFFDVWGKYGRFKYMETIKELKDKLSKIEKENIRD